MCCPLTTKVEKPWPWLLKVDEQSAVIADQMRCVDWVERKARFKAKASPEVVEKVVKLFTLIISPL
jgi:mRNA interferase MazF